MSDPKRRKISQDAVDIIDVIDVVDTSSLFLDLPIELIQAILKYDTLWICSLVCTKLRDAIRVWPRLLCISKTDMPREIQCLEHYPRNASPYEIRISMNNRYNLCAIDTYLKARGYSFKNPLFRGAVVLRVTVHLKERIPSDEETFLHTLRALVSLNNVERMVLNVWNAMPILNSISPDTCVLRNLQLLGGWDNTILDHPTIKIPTSIKLAGFISAQRIAVTKDTFNSRLRSLDVAVRIEVKVSGKYVGLLSEKKACDKFAGWYTFIKTLCYTRGNPNNIFHPDDEHVVAKALLRGNSMNHNGIPDWAWDEVPATGLCTQWAMNGAWKRCKVPNKVVIDPRGIERGVFSERRVYKPHPSFMVACGDMLRNPVPPTADYTSFEQWTNKRFISIMYMTDVDTQNKLFSAEIASPFTRGYAIAWILKRLRRGGYDLDMTIAKADIIRLSRLLPPETMSGEAKARLKDLIMQIKTDV